MNQAQDVVLGRAAITIWWAVEDLNLRPLACEASALTAELTAPQISAEPPHSIGRAPVPRRCALGGTRTHGLSLRRAALYPLSYKRVKPVPASLARKTYDQLPG